MAALLAMTALLKTGVLNTHGLLRSTDGSHKPKWITQTVFFNNLFSYALNTPYTLTGKGDGV